jgi:large subunit ribosomal protein L16
MLQPKRVKYRRPHGIKYEGLSKAGNEVSFGEYGLQAVSGNWISARQIEAPVSCGQLHQTQRHIWIRIYPHLAKTKKPAEVRMGSGKGPPNYGWPSSKRTASCSKSRVPEATAREACA